MPSAARSPGSRPTAATPASRAFPAWQPSRWSRPRSSATARPASRAATTCPPPGSTPPLFARAVRAHWGIENRLHWVLDVVFHDDLARLRTGHGPENMATVRHMAVNLVRERPRQAQPQGPPQESRLEPRLSGNPPPPAPPEHVQAIALQLLRRNRRPPIERVQLLEVRRQRLKCAIGHRQDRPQRMPRRHPALAAHIAEQTFRPPIRPAHPQPRRQPRGQDRITAMRSKPAPFSASSLGRTHRDHSHFVNDGSRSPEPRGTSVRAIFARTSLPTKHTASPIHPSPAIVSRANLSYAAIRRLENLRKRHAVNRRCFEP